MSPNRSRFVTACQQVLALAVVLAVLTPAAGVVTLDVVGSAPDGTPAGAVPAARPDRRDGGVRRAGRPPLAGADGPGRAHVREVQLTSPSAAVGRSAPTTSAARVTASRYGQTTLTTTPQPVTGFGTIGVTWTHGDAIPQADLNVSVRTRTARRVERLADRPLRPRPRARPGHGRGTPRAPRHRARPRRHRRRGPGADQPQSARCPPDLQLAVINPGTLPPPHRSVRPSTPAPWTAATAPTRSTRPRRATGGAGSAGGASDTAPSPRRCSPPSR